MEKKQQNCPYLQRSDCSYRKSYEIYKKHLENKGLAKLQNIRLIYKNQLYVYTHKHTEATLKKLKSLKNPIYNNIKNYKYLRDKSDER